MTYTDHSTSALKREIDGLANILTCLDESADSMLTLASMSSDIKACINSGGQIIVMGNGGFAAVGQHFISELAGRYSRHRKPLRAISLDSNVALITCIANDYGYERIYSRQLKAVGHRGDIAIVLTASGRSKNIIEALVTARDMGIATLGFTGNEKLSPTLTSLLDSHIAVPSGKASHVQDATMCMLHALCSDIDSGYREPAAAAWHHVLQLAAIGCYDTLLLDRDGVINRLLPNGYITSSEQLVMEPAFLDACNALAATFPRIIVVTNQSCVGKGIISAEELATIHRYMTDAVAAASGRIDAIFFCSDAKESPRRKPATGMADDIRAAYPGIDFARAIMVGDSSSDQLFAERIGATYVDVNRYDRD